MKVATLADRILRLSSAQIPHRQLNLAITLIMMQRGGGHNALLGYEGVRKGRYRIDEGFVSDLLKTTQDPRIIESPAFACLPLSVYRRLFFRYWRLRSHREPWRYALGWSLGPFLMSNPQAAPLFAGPIWALAADPDERVANRGLYVTQYLGRALTLEQCEALIAFTHHDSNRAGTALSSLGGLYKHIKDLRPDVRKLLLDARTIATLRSAHPPDGRDKVSCYGWCMQQVRAALARARRGRVLSAVK